MSVRGEGGGGCLALHAVCFIFRSLRALAPFPVRFGAGLQATLKFLIPTGIKTGPPRSTVVRRFVHGGAPMALLGLTIISLLHGAHSLGQPFVIPCSLPPNSGLPVDNTCVSAIPWAGARPALYPNALLYPMPAGT